MSDIYGIQCIWNEWYLCEYIPACFSFSYVGVAFVSCRIFLCSYLSKWKFCYEHIILLFQEVTRNFIIPMTKTSNYTSFDIQVNWLVFYDSSG